jgi:serine/threonine protein kinase
VERSSNVIVTPEGLLKVLDFGLARRLAAVQDDETRTLDTLESVVTTGDTLSYISPEVLRGELGDYRSDLTTRD